MTGSAHENPPVKLTRTSSISLGLALTGMAFILSVGWKIATAANNLQYVVHENTEAIQDLKSLIKDVDSQVVRRADLARWIKTLEQVNQGKEVVIPDWH